MKKIEPNLKSRMKNSNNQLNYRRKLYRKEMLLLVKRKERSMNLKEEHKIWISSNLYLIIKLKN